ncbi:MAG: helix-turn-helix domain-containing protein [Pseudomonadota bacterium]
MAHASDPKSKSPFLTAIEAASYLRLEVRTLNNMRWRQEGPSWRKHGGRVVYHINELQYWSRRRDSNPDNRPKRGERGTHGE